MSADGEQAVEVTQNKNKNFNEEYKEPNLWKEFRLSIPNFFSDEKISKKHIEEFLHNIINNKDTVTVLFVPHSAAGCEPQHSEQLKSYTDFTIWFIGQLLRMLCTDKLSYAHKLSLAAQSTLLSIFADKSIEMLRKILLEYTKFVTELLNAINGFYINKSKSEYSIDCFMYNFIVKSRGKCCILLEKILILIKSQCCVLSECSLDLISIIWSIVLKVLSNINSVTITTAVQLAATLIKNGELPSICDVAVLCEKISLLLLFVTNAFYKNKKVSQANSLINHLLIAFSDLFNAFSSLSYQSLKKIANFLLKMLSSLLKQKSPLITSELVASSTCQLLCTLLTVQPVEDLIIDVKDLNQLMNDIQCCQNIMPVVKIFCQNEIIKQFKDSKEHCRQIGERLTVVQANEMSITLNSVLNLLADNTNSINHLNKENFYNLLKLMNAVAKLVSDLSSVCDEFQNCTGNEEKPILSFFGEKFYKDFISVTAIFTDKIVLADFEGVNYLFEISSVLLTLPEINIISVAIVKQLIAFQSLPWWKYSFLFELDLCGTSFQDTIEAFINHQDSVFQVDRVKKLCLRTLGQIPCDIDIGWRLQLFSRYFNDNESDGADLLRCVPFMLYNCRSVLPSLVDSLLQPALSSSNPCVQSVVPDVVSLVLCVLSASAHLVRLLNCEGFNIKCKECDLSEEQDAAVSCNQIRPLLNGFLNLFTAASPQVLCKVITVLPKLANHLPFIHSPDCVKRWILFVKNPNVHVRDVFSKVVVDLVFRRKWVERKKLHSEEDLPLSQADRLELVHSEPLLESFNKQVMSAVQLSLINKDTSLQLTIMSTIRSMGCAPVDCVIYPCVRMLLIFISHPYSVKPSVAQVHLQAIAEAHNKRVLDIFEKYRGEFCKLIIDILMLYSPEDKKDLMCFVQQLAYGLTYYSCRSFLTHNTSDYLLKYLLASLINKPQLDWMLEYFAEFTGTTVSVLVSEGFQHIYPYLYMEADEAVLKDCCKYMESITGLKIQTLICLSFKRITIEILLYYNTNKDKVMQGLNFLMQLADEGQPSSDGDVVKFLANRFLGVLNFMEGVLVSKHVSDTDKRNILLTLPDIIRLLGPTYNTPVRLKVLAMLRAALTVCHGFFPDLTCAAWEAFIYNVEVAALGSLLSTIFVSLLSLLNNFPDEIRRMLHYLVIENEDTLNDYFDELFFVPDLNSIHDIYNVIQAKIKQKTSKMSFIEQLQSTLNVAKHENVEVRLHGLKKLRLQVINWTAISDLIINNDSLHPVIIDFLDTLITGTRDEEERIRIACGECLGELGALDPGRLPNNLLVKNVYHKGHLQLNTSDFAYSALMVLVKGFQEARYTVSMDEIAFAIQELLKIYKISPVSKDIWNRFPISVQERMLPFLNSWYMHNTSVDKSITDLLPHPVFGSYRGKTMMSWAYNWACFLIPLVLQDFAQQVFRACQFSFKKDTSIMMFFLPYILLYALLSCSENHKKMIEEEIKAVICYSDEDSQREVDGRKETLYKVRKDCVTNDKFSDKEDATTQMMCIKIIYSLLDFLYQWLRETKKHFSITKKISVDFTTTNYDTVSEFLERFSLLDIAKGSFNCQEYSRSLLYMEEYVVKNPDKLEELLPSIGKIYSQLNEPDGLRGVIASHQHEPTPNEILLYHEITGRLHDAATCYEHLAALEAQQSAQCDKNVVKGMVGCYLSMDQPFTALHLSESLLARISQFLITHDLHGEQAEALWSLGRMDQLEAMFQDHSELNYNDSWGINIAQAMVHLKQHNEALMLSKLNILRKSLVERLLSRSAMSSGGYKQGYDYIVRLHILNEFEKIGKLVLNLPSDTDNCDNFDNENIVNCGQYLEKQFKELVAMEFDQRLKLLQPSSRVLQPVLGMRRVLLSLAENMVPANLPSVHSCLRQEIGRSWLKSIAVARKSNNFQQAYSNILSAEQLKPNGLFIEKAKLHWAKLEKDTALTTLKRGIEQTFPSLVASADINSSIAQLSIDNRKLLAKARLLIATYNDQNVEMETNLSCYIEAVEARRDWEKSIICLAQFQYKIFISYDEIQKQSVEGLECQEKLVKYFGKSLQYGCKYIYQSMPRMLSIWLEFGVQFANNSSKSSSAASSSNQIANIIEQKKAMIKLNKLIEGFIDKLPLFMFMTSYSQLLSRICHPQNDCYNLLKKILARIIKSYPEQSLWLFIAASKSKHVLRVKRCEELLNEQIIVSDKKLLNFISCMNQLHNCLIEFSNKECSAKETVSFSSLNKKLPRLLKEASFCQILLPLQKFMTVSLPRSNDYSDHNPYPLKMVYIHSVKEEVTVLKSLQKPKKFTVIGSDGLEYFMMVKANDDLRFDARLMDFFNIINMYLQRDAEGRDRRLHIRTYSVLALNENSGLIEWISNLSTYRNVIQNLYLQMNIKVNDLQNNYYNINVPLLQKRQHFVNNLLKKYPPVLRKWFLQEFPHPVSWYQARTAYVRTAAVMSIVGYMVGLGDRHTDNILLDICNGEVMHVDFNCCCNIGEEFQWPERVPFRLTHNIVDAMGPTGYEGMFVQSCEITNHVMRQQREQLISVLKPLIYDSLIKRDENKLRKKIKSGQENCEMTNELNVKRLKDIELRLEGSLRIIPKNKYPAIGKQSQSLSVEGQTRSLIHQATDVDNLCQMYVGWTPFF